VVRDYIQDPLVYRSMTASLATALVDAVSRTAVRAPEVQVPLLMLHGEADPLCRPSGSRSFFQALESPESDLVVYPELRHEIFNEPEREQVYQDIWDWLERISK
jgi:alpha-beta hydrolase superfamily lysophospholipase